MLRKQLFQLDEASSRIERIESAILLAGLARVVDPDEPKGPITLDEVRMRGMDPNVPASFIEDLLMVITGADPFGPDALTKPLQRINAVFPDGRTWRPS